MIDQSTDNGRIVAAALALAAERPWREVTLRDIAERAGVGLAGMRDVAGTKGEVLALFARQIDDEVLANAPKPEPGEAKRDALFEVVMARFDALAPYKPALRSIMADGATDPALLRAMLSSQAWMLQAAGIDSGGVQGSVRVAGLASVYASVARMWLDDDDPGLARTMAVLDRRLRRGERTLAAFDEVGNTVKRIGEGIASLFAGASRAKPADEAPSAAGPPPSKPAPDMPISA